MLASVEKDLQQAEAIGEEALKEVVITQNPQLHHTCLDIRGKALELTMLFLFAS
jgi:hypothetical protein